jgi:hypothetical protein
VGYAKKDAAFKDFVTDPAFSSVIKIANALGIELTDLFKADTVLKDVNPVD